MAISRRAIYSLSQLNIDHIELFLAWAEWRLWTINSFNQMNVGYKLYLSWASQKQIINFFWHEPVGCGKLFITWIDQFTYGELFIAYCQCSLEPIASIDVSISCQFACAVFQRESVPLLSTVCKMSHGYQRVWSTVRPLLFDLDVEQRKREELHHRHRLELRLQQRRLRQDDWQWYFPIQLEQPITQYFHWLIPIGHGYIDWLISTVQVFWLVKYLHKINILIHIYSSKTLIRNFSFI